MLFFLSAKECKRKLAVWTRNSVVRIWLVFTSVSHIHKLLCIRSWTEKKPHTHTQENETEREKKNQAKREIIYMCYWCGSKFRKGFSNNLTKSAFRGAYRYTQPTISKYVFLFVKWFRLKEFRPNMRTRNCVYTHS